MRWKSMAQQLEKDVRAKNGAIRDETAKKFSGVISS